MKRIALGLLCGFLVCTRVAVAGGFTLSSESVHDATEMVAQQVYDRFGCHGKNLSPQLSWSQEPSGTKSFAVTVYDPDAPTGSGWWHWLVVNIPVSVHELAEGASGNKHLPQGALEIRNDFGSYHYGGPCPPAGQKHHYVVTVWALKEAHLDLSHHSTAAMAGFMLMSHALDKAQMMPVYQRSDQQ